MSIDKVKLTKEESNEFFEKLKNSKLKLKDIARFYFKCDEYILLKKLNGEINMTIEEYCELFVIKKYIL